MRDGFVKVAAVTPKIRVADTTYNAGVIVEGIREAAAAGAKVIVLPELVITGYTCSDLFLQEYLLEQAKRALGTIAEETAEVDAILFVGLPLAYNGKLYNVAAVLCRGEVLGFVPKTYLPNYNEFYEARHFARGMADPVEVDFEGECVPMGTRLLFVCTSLPELKIGAELCEDLWTPEPPSIRHARNGATLLVNLSASDETTGKDIYRRELVNGQSARLLCGYIYASAGDGESTQDVVYSGHNVIAENGHILKESERFGSGVICTEIDVKRIEAERRRMTTFEMADDSYVEVRFSLETEETALTRFIDPMPFVPGNEADRIRRCDEILAIQAAGLKKRLEHTHCKTAVVGISGGLDSTLALLVTVRAFDLLGMPHDRIKAVTMPGFGTTDRTYDNAVSLIRCLGADFTEVDIKEAVNVHFRDIGQDPAVHDVFFNNILQRPLGWGANEYSSYFGTFSPAKYQYLMDVTGYTKAHFEQVGAITQGGRGTKIRQTAVTDLQRRFNLGYARLQRGDADGWEEWLLEDRGSMMWVPGITWWNEETLPEELVKQYYKPQANE